MPIKVYVAPFRWYEKSKQQESFVYNKMVYDAFDLWSQLTGGKVTFRFLAQLDGSQIDLSWRRVDRTSLGHCEYMANKQGQMGSAEIKIGISDGLVHAKYNDRDEVQHTILHEIGHALGLVGHSDASDDIMYVPHQYGVTNISPRDAETLNTIYELPTGFDFLALGRKHKMPEPFTIHDVLDLLAGRAREPEAAHVIDFIPPPPVMIEQPEILANQHDILSQMGRFHLATQNIRVNPAVKKMFTQPDSTIDPPS